MYFASSSLARCAPILPSLEPVLSRSHANSARSTPESSDSTASRSFACTTGSSSGSSGTGIAFLRAAALNDRKVDAEGYVAEKQCGDVDANFPGQRSEERENYGAPPHSGHEV